MVHNCLMVATAMRGFILHCAHLLHSAPAAGQPGQLQREGSDCMCLRCHAEVSWQPSCMTYLLTSTAHSAGVSTCTLHALQHSRAA